MTVTVGGTNITFNDGKTQSTSAISQFQTWASQTRALGTTYTNSTGRPIMVMVCINNPSSVNAYVQVQVGGVSQGFVGVNSAARDNFRATWTAIILNSQTYGVFTQVGSPSISQWFELR